MHWLLLTPYFASGEAVGTTKETADSYSPLMHTRSKKFARGRCISADLGHTEELNGICAEKSLRERGVLIFSVESGWGFFDRIGLQTNAYMHPAAAIPLQRDHYSGPQAWESLH